MVLLLCPLVDLQDTVNVTRKVAKQLASQGIRCVADEELRPILGGDDIEYIPKNLAEAECDIVVAVGGDGTMLRMSQRAIAIDKPIFGINTGRIGFLSAFDGNAVEEITAEAIEKLRKSNRLLLDFSLSDNPDRHYYAVNDIVISKSFMTNTIEVNVDYGPYSVGRIRADGVIVSTPTGSTAYSLSAGGPIVAPAVEAFLITPICAHSLVSRSFVLGSKDTVTISPSGRINNRGQIAVDGVTIGEINENSTVIIKTAEKSLRLLTSEKRNFYGILSREISEKD